MEIIKINKEEMQEVSIWKELVFNKSFFHQFSDRLGDLATINVCDIGSGFPARTILLLENYTLEKVVCVDSMSEKELVSAFINPPPSNSEKKITTFADYYFRNEEQKTETIKAFNDIFLSKSYLNSDVDFFLNGTNNEEYNLVLCTNFFHLFEDIKYIETLLDKIANLINPKTVVFFQVETKKWFNYELYLKLIITKFNGTVFEMYENNTLKESCFINLCK